MTWWLPFMHVLIIVLVAAVAMLFGHDAGLSGLYAACMAGMLSIATGLVSTRCYTREPRATNAIRGLAFGPIRLFLLVLVAIAVRDLPSLQQTAALLSAVTVLALTQLLDALVTRRMLLRLQDKECMGG